jgi:hypothetical protein
MYPSQSVKIYWYPSTTYQVFDSTQYELAPEYVTCGCMQYQLTNGVTYARVDPTSAEGQALDMNAGAFDTSSTGGTATFATGSDFSTGFTSTFAGNNDFTFGTSTGSFGMPSPSPSSGTARDDQFIATPSPQ